MTPQDTPARRWDFDRVFRLALLAAGIGGLLWLLRFLADVLVPFALALLLAYLLNPVVEAFQERLGGRRWPAVMVTVFGAFVVCFSLVLILVPITFHEFRALGEQIQELGFVREMREGAPLGDQVQQGQRSIAQAYRAFRDRRSPWLQEILDDTVAALSEQLNAERVSALARELVRGMAPGLLGLVSGAVSFLLGLTGLIVVLVYLVFILLDYGRVARGWPELLPPAYQATILQFVDEFSLAMRRYFRGQFIISVVLGLWMALGFWLIGLRMGVLLGLFMGVLSIVPYLQVVGLVPALLLGVLRALEHGSSVAWSLILVLLVLAVAQIIQDVLLTPRIMGKATGLRPVVIILGVFVWGKLLGFLGLLLAIPLTCLGIAYYSRFVLGQPKAKVVEGTGTR